MYNSRGWAYDLFTDEDIVLLNEKIDELNQGNLSTDYKLNDKSQLIELNNKMIVFYGNRSEPIIHAVMVINAENEYEAEPIKEVVYNEFADYRIDKTSCTALLNYVQEVTGNEYDGIYISDSFQFTKGSAGERTRAILPDDFSNYGYTKQFQDRTGNHTETTPEFSKRVDADYLSAVERGDMETAQRMVDEAQLKKAAAGNACDSFCNYSAILISTGNQINLLR